MVKPKCDRCDRRDCATHVLFCVALNKNNLHFDNTSKPTHCLNCALTIIKIDWKEHTQLRDRQYLGVLTRRQAEKYALLCKPDGAAHQFAVEGFTTVKAESVNSSKVAAFSGMMDLVLEGNAASGRKSNSITLDNLADSLSDRGIGDKFDSHRRWKQLYPHHDEFHHAPSSKNNEKDMRSRLYLDIQKMLVPSLSQIIFPHHYYALLSFRVATHELCKGNMVETPNPELLNLHHANALIKGIGLDHRQGAHFDQRDFNLLVIMVKHCSKQGYYFHYIPRSHNLVHCHQKQKNEPWPVGEMKCVQVRADNIIVFADSLIHAGGQTSMTPEEYNRARAWHEGATPSIIPQLKLYNGWFEGNICDYPTDISLQLTFQFTPVGSTCQVGWAAPSWYYREIPEDDTEEYAELRKGFRSLIEKNDGVYAEAIQKSFESWLDIMDGKKLKPSQKRHKHKH